MLAIPPDYTFLLQILMFLALWLVLRRWWFEPALRVLDARSKRSEGALEEARTVQEEAERLRREHQSALDAARAEAHREVQELLRAAEAEQKRLISAAGEEAQRTLAAARRGIEEDVAAARRELRGQVSAIAREVARTVLGRTV